METVGEEIGVHPPALLAHSPRPGGKPESREGPSSLESPRAELERGLEPILGLDPELGSIHGLEYTRLHFAMGIVGDVGEGSSSSSDRTWRMGEGGTAEDEDEGKREVGDGIFGMTNESFVGVGVGVGVGSGGGEPATESLRLRRLACPCPSASLLASGASGVLFPPQTRVSG